ncbi:MAG: ATP-grasp domain-containing protein [Oscillospiraceae bacterium]|nr:ATP-grasp domain-containing protein [Oscillospiraceae bacterium]
MKVLVTDIKYRMALAAIRDLAQAGYRVEGLHFGEGTPPAQESRFLSACHFAGDFKGASRADAIYEVAEKCGADAVFPVGAHSIAALAENPREGVLLPDAAALELAGDKLRLADIAREAGVKVPKKYSCPDEVEEFPVVVKYRNGELLGLGAPQRYAIAKNSDELADKYSKMASVAQAGGQEPPVIQQYIPGGGWGVSCVFDRSSRPVSIICHQRLREYPLSGGPSTLCQSVWSEELVSSAVTLLKVLEWRGIAMVEFRGCPETGFYLLEINPRVWGTFPLTRVTKSGFSEKYVRASLGEELPECTAPGFDVGVKMGFRYSNLAAGAAYLKRGDVKNAFAAVNDAFSKNVIDGVLDAADPEGSKAYSRSVFRRRGK